MKLDVTFTWQLEIAVRCVCLNNKNSEIMIDLQGGKVNWRM